VYLVQPTSETWIQGLTWEWFDNRFIIHSSRPLHTISSAVYGGGIRRDVRFIMNMTVDKHYCSDDPGSDLREAIKLSGLSESMAGIGLLTAVDVKKVQNAYETVGNACVMAAVTAGTSNALRAGMNINDSNIGTVNIIVFVSGSMPDSAMVNAMITVTEAKATIFQEYNIVCTSSGLVATGTTTDAVVIAACGEGPSFPYAGPGTDVGMAIARAVRRALAAAIREEVKGERL
jgi:adenosylcobinamide hydrolase